MLTIYLCLGSSCFVRGSDLVAKSLQASIERHELQDTVDIVGTFCLEHCSMGVTLKVDEQIFEGVRPEAADEFFTTEILPRVQMVREVQ
jgi:NADH:ubiquinone oxidoreductase subunit E